MEETERILRKLVDLNHPTWGELDPQLVAIKEGGAEERFVASTEKHAVLKHGMPQQLAQIQLVSTEAAIGQNYCIGAKMNESEIDGRITAAPSNAESITKSISATVPMSPRIRKRMTASRREFTLPRIIRMAAS